MNQDATLAKLLEGWLDGGLTEAEQAELLGLLAGDPDLRRRFAAQVATFGATRAAADANPRWLALFDVLEHHAGPTDVISTFESDTMSRIDAATRHRPPRVNPAVWGLAAAVALLLTGLFLMNHWQQEPAAPPIARPDPGAATPPAVDERHAAPAHSVAVVIGGSPEAGVRPGDDLKPGALSQQQGWLTLQTLSGVSVMLEAPFEINLIDHDRIHLKNGVARVRVPDGAEGFRLESPAFNVVDLGTEFAARVNPDGTGTCRVFEGLAEVSLVDSMGESKQTRRLAANESLLINRSQQTLRAIKEPDSSYPSIQQTPRPKLRLTPGYPATVIGMEPSGYWRFESIAAAQVPNEVPGPARMNAAGSAAIVAEDGGNHSGELTRLDKPEFFKIQGATQEVFVGDFTISLFAQFSWLQNFALVSGMRYDRQVQGHPLILQCYASLSKIGIKGSALHSVLRDPPAWDGGAEILGAARLQPLRWHHLAMSREGDTVSIFLDGSIVARGPASAAPLDCREIYVGRLNGNPGQSRAEARGLVGHIDELALFPRALSAEAIRLLAAGNQLALPE